MTQQTAPFIEGKYGWALGESGWNTGMDENMLKFSYMLDGNVDSIVTTLPSPAVNGTAYYLSSENRIYYAAGGSYYSVPVPKWFLFKIRSTGVVYQFDGTSINLKKTAEEVSAALQNSLGSAAYQPTTAFATPSSVTSSTNTSKAYTDTLRSDLSATTGSTRVGYSGRAVSDRFGDLPSLKDCGVSGVDDGVDRTTVIQQFLTANTGKTVYIPEGTYLVTTLNVACNLTGKGIIKRLNGSSQNLINISANNISISGISVDGNKANASGLVFNIYSTGYNNTIIDGVRSYNSLSHSIYLRAFPAGAARGGIIRNCNISASGFNGINYESAFNLLIQNNVVDGSAGHGISCSGAINTSDEITITGNIVKNCSLSGIAIPYVDNSTTLFPITNRCIINNNNVNNNLQHGILAQAYFSTVNGNVSHANGNAFGLQGLCINAWYVSCVGNVVTNSYGIGIDFGDCARISCVGNVVDGSGQWGIEVNSVDQGTVTGNLLSNNCRLDNGPADNGGIVLQKGTGSYVFSGNTTSVSVTGNTVVSGPFQKYGIRVTADVDNSIISNNVCISSGSIQDISILSSSCITSNNLTNLTSSVAATLTAASTLTISDVGSYFAVAGSGTINTITTTGGKFERGREVTFRFGSAITLADSTGNLFLVGNFTTANGSTLRLLSDGSGGWIEMSRSTT